MTRLLRNLALEGFLAEAMDGTQNDATPKPPATPYLKLSIGKFYACLAWGPDTIKRLEGMKTLVGEKAGQKIDALVATVQKQVVATKKSVDENKATTAEVVVRGTLAPDGRRSRPRRLANVHADRL
jgi:hypothetical protein